MPRRAFSRDEASSKALPRPSLSTILVVDDDPGTRLLLRLILETDGHEIVEAANGHAALGLIDPNPLPDVIMTDLTMPILNGHGLIERIRSEPRTASIPIVVVSANPDAAQALHASGRIEAFVIKPFDASVLSSCIRNVVSAPMRPVVA
jgi:two-component system, chemotaxis family, chemotaxis protein CheY